MKFQDRANITMRLLRKNGLVTVEELSELLQISLVTVRKDLQRMEEQGLLIRTFGGAALRTSDPEKERRLLAMQQIAERAAQEIQDGDCLLVNAGYTTRLTARKLLNRKQLKVITNSVAIARELSSQPEIQVIFLGGEINATAVFTYGRDAIGQLDQYKAHKLLLSVNGISCSKGLTTRHMEASDLMRKMIERTEKVIVAADHSKLGFESFYHVGEINKVDQIITDAHSSSERELENMERMGIMVCRCE